MRRLAVLGIVSLTALACSSGDRTPAGEATAAKASAIINGTPDTNPAHDGIVAFAHIAFGTQWDSLCSATVIAADPTTGVGYALTASHCVIPLPSEMFPGYTKADITKMQIISGPSTDMPTTRFKVDDFVVADGANDKHIPYLDLCIVKFHGDPAAVAALPLIPILPPELDDMADGSAIEFVGYGDRMAGSQTMVGAKYHATSKLGTVTGAFSQPVPGADFWLLASPTPADGTSTCQGDSGGPWLYTAKDGKQYLAGVTSIGGANCTVFAIASRPGPTVKGFIDAYTSGKPAGDSCDQCLFNTAAFPALACDSVREPCVSTSGDCNTFLTACQKDAACTMWLNGCGCAATDMACNDKCNTTVSTNAAYIGLQGCWNTKCATPCGTMGTGGSGGSTGAGGAGGSGAGGDVGTGGTGGSTGPGTGGAGPGTGGTGTSTGGTGTAGAGTGTGGTTTSTGGTSTGPGTGGSATGTGGSGAAGKTGNTAGNGGATFAGGFGAGGAGAPSSNPDSATDASSGSSGGCSVPDGNGGPGGAALLLGVAALVTVRRRKSA